MILVDWMVYIATGYYNKRRSIQTLRIWGINRNSGFPMSVFMRGKYRILTSLQSYRASDSPAASLMTLLETVLTA